MDRDDLSVRLMYYLTVPWKTDKKSALSLEDNAEAEIHILSGQI